MTLLFLEGTARPGMGASEKNSLDLSVMGQQCRDPSDRLRTPYGIIFINSHFSLSELNSAKHHLF